LEVPALKVTNEIKPEKEILINKISRRDIFELDASGRPTDKLIVKEDSYIDDTSAQKIEQHYAKSKTLIKVKPFFKENDLFYISPELDEKCIVADLNATTDEFNNITSSRVA